MAISKRTRYEVLRRDAFTCRYCGSSAPNVELHVDHVTPVALGGTDEPTNLVAACVDCNLGKASTSPDDETVADVAADALRWMRAIEEVARRSEEQTSVEEDVTYKVDERWLACAKSSWGEESWRPLDWESTVLGYFRAGLQLREILTSVDIAYAARIYPSARFSYFCGVMRNKLADVQAQARSLIERGEV